MTERELAAVLGGIAPAVKAYAAKAVGALETRIADVEGQVKALPAAEPEIAVEDAAASFTGLLTKELTALLPTRSVKRVTRSDHGYVVEDAET